MAAPARTSTTLDVVTSATAADVLVAELDDLADRVELEAAETGASRITKARVRSLRRHARQIEGLHLDAEQ